MYKILSVSEKLDGEKFHYQTLNILQSNHFFLTGLKSYWSKINDDDALGFVDIKYYIPWIRGILIKHVRKYVFYRHTFYFLIYCIVFVLMTISALKMTYLRKNK